MKTKFKEWCNENWKVIFQIAVFFVILGLSLVVVGSQRHAIAAIAESRPVLTSVIAGIGSLLAGLLIASRLRTPERWKDYRDVAAISLITLTAVGAGTYLIGVAA